MTKRTIDSLQDLTVQSILRQAMEQRPADVMRLLTEVRQGGPTLCDEDVLEVVDYDGLVTRYRVLVREVPPLARTLLEQLLDERPMFGATVHIGESVQASGTANHMGDMDEDLYDKWEAELGRHISNVFQIPMPTTWDYGDECDQPGEILVPGLGWTVRNLVFVLGRMSGLLQQWNATLIEPTHNYDRFGADALFHPKNMEELDVSRAWPPDDYLWL